MWCNSNAAIAGACSPVYFYMKWSKDRSSVVHTDAHEHTQMQSHKRPQHRYVKYVIDSQLLFVFLSDPDKSESMTLLRGRIQTHQIMARTKKKVCANQRFWIHMVLVAVGFGFPDHFIWPRIRLCFVLFELQTPGSDLPCCSHQTLRQSLQECLQLLLIPHSARFSHTSFRRMSQSSQTCQVGQTRRAKVLHHVAGPSSSWLKEFLWGPPSLHNRPSILIPLSSWKGRTNVRECARRGAMFIIQVAFKLSGSSSTVCTYYLTDILWLEMKFIVIMIKETHSDKIMTSSWPDM